MEAPKLYKLPAEAKFQPVTHSPEGDEVHIMWLSNPPDAWTSMSMTKEQAQELLQQLSEAAAAGMLGGALKQAS